MDDISRVESLIQKMIATGEIKKIILSIIPGAICLFPLIDLFPVKGCP